MGFNLLTISLDDLILYSFFFGFSATYAGFKLIISLVSAPNFLDKTAPCECPNVETFFLPYFFSVSCCAFLPLLYLSVYSYKPVKYATLLPQSFNPDVPL